MATECKTVPVEPTKEMIGAGYVALSEGDGGEADALHCYQAMLAAAPTADACQVGSQVDSGWRPIDSATENGTPVLLWCGEVVSGWYEEGYTYGWIDHRGHHINPTHWMPLPASPVEGK